MEVIYHAPVSCCPLKALLVFTVMQSPGLDAEGTEQRSDGEEGVWKFGPCFLQAGGVACSAR